MEPAQASPSSVSTNAISRAKVASEQILYRCMMYDICTQYLLYCLLLSAMSAATRHKYCCDKVPIACGPKIPRRSVNTLQPKTLCFGHQRQQVKRKSTKQAKERRSAELHAITNVSSQDNMSYQTMTKVSSQDLHECSWSQTSWSQPAWSQQRSWSQQSQTHRTQSTWTRQRLLCGCMKDMTKNDLRFAFRKSNRC